MSLFNKQETVDVCAFVTSAVPPLCLSQK